MKTNVLEFNRIIKKGKTIVVFGQQPTYSEMILSNLKDFKYELIWQKNNAAQGFHADKMPLIYTENIAVFIHNENKENKRTFNNIANETEINKEEHFCRWYAQQLFKFTNLKRRKIHEIMKHRKLEFFFCFTSKHFGLLSESLYNDLIEKFDIRKFEHFLEYKELKKKWDEEKNITKGIKLDAFEYSKTLNNILVVNKETNYFHPTQKPVELMKKLISMYTNENDIVLDCFLGAGSTAIAAKQLKKRFIGSELDKEFYELAIKRIELEI
ncbi:site-specific DNA-methyltransferase [Mycoplasma struthionis]|nr:site-specific DNA-methyltransferase [Mycoplasma struthionis]